MLTTHRVIPLPSYDTNGNLIPPHRYKTALIGALVRVNFKLSHWYIKPRQNTDAMNTFVADLTSLRILVDPPVTTTPTKRKTAKRDPEIASSSKKKKN